MKKTIEIPAFQFESTCRIMLKRIAKGYSAVQLNFLIGAPEHYVEEVETMEGTFYSLDDLERITLALEERDFESFFPCSNDLSMLKISVEKKSNEGRFHTIYSRVNEQGEQERLYEIKEKKAPGFEDIPGAAGEYSIISDALQLLIRAGYFYQPKLPLDVFHSINRFIGYHQNPLLLQMAMVPACGADQERPLGIVQINGQGFHYQEW